MHCEFYTNSSRMKKNTIFFFWIATRNLQVSDQVTHLIRETTRSPSSMCYYIVPSTIFISTKRNLIRFPTIYSNNCPLFSTQQRYPLYYIIRVAGHFLVIVTPSDISPPPTDGFPRQYNYSVSNYKINNQLVNYTFLFQPTATALKLNNIFF